MNSAPADSRSLFALRGGAGTPLLVLLHGLGANANVWTPMLEHIARDWPGRWIAPDLRGHGRSPRHGPFGIGIHAADIAQLIAHETAHDENADVVIVGHSFGGVVAGVIGSGMFGIAPREIIAFGIKVDWTEAEIERMQEIGRRPLRDLATRAEAVERHLKFAGLHGLLDPASPLTDGGIIAHNGAWRLALNPHAFGAVKGGVEPVMKQCIAPLRLGSGALDQMAPPGALLRVDAQAVTFADCGHNAHWEKPAAVWDFINKN